MKNQTLTTLTIEMKASNDQLRADFDKTNRYVSNWARHTREHAENTARVATKNFGTISSTAATTAKSVAGLFTLIGANAGILQAIQHYADFEKALVGVGKTTNISGQALVGLGDQIEMMSHKLPITSTELLETAESAGQLGVKGTKNLVTFVDTIARLGASSDLSGSTAATTLARILNITGDGIETIGTLGSVIVALGNEFEATESEIARMTNEVARSTAVFNVNSASAAAVSTSLKSMGIQAEIGGSVVGRAFRAIDTTIRNGGESLKYLANITGIASDQLKASFSKDSTDVFQRFAAGLGRAMKSGQSAAVVLEEFGLKGEEVQKVLPALGKNANVLARAIELAGRETKTATALISESEKAFATLSSDLTRAENSAKSVAKSFAKRLAPSIQTAAREFTGFVNGTQGAQKVTDNFITAASALGIVMTARLTRGLQNSALAAAQYQKQIIAGNIVTLDSVKADEQRAALSAKVASNDLMKANAAVIAAKSELQSVKSTQTMIVAERQLETGRLKAQITEIGRRQSISRLVEQRRAELAIAKNVAAAEANLSAAQNAAAAASTKATAATAAHTIAQQNALVKTRLLNTATTALKSTMNLLGGPLGVIALAGYSLYQYSQNAKLAAISNDELTNKLRELKGEGQQVHLEQEMERYIARVKEAKNELQHLESKRINLETSISKQNRPAHITELSVLKDIDNEITAKEQRITKLSSVIDAFKLKLADLNKPVDKNENEEVDIIISGSSVKDINDEYEKLNISLKRQIALFGSVSEAARVRYEIENGQLKGLSKTKQDILLKEAKKLDNLKAMDSINNSSAFDKVIQDLSTDEDRIRGAYQRRRDIILAHTKETDSIRKVLTTRNENELQEKLLDINQKKYAQLDDLAKSHISSVINGRKSLKDASVSLLRESAAQHIKAKLLQSEASGLAAVQEAWASAPFPANIKNVIVTTGKTLAINAAISALTPSFERGGFTGKGPRQGGIDGRGGFPAIVHPNETIIDHNSGQKLGSNVIVNIIENSSRAGEVNESENNIDIYVDRLRGAMIDDVNRGRGLGEAIKNKYSLTTRSFA